MLAFRHGEKVRLEPLTDAHRYAARVVLVTPPGEQKPEQWTYGGTCGDDLCAQVFAAERLPADMRSPHSPVWQFIPTHETSQGTVRRAARTWWEEAGDTDSTDTGWLGLSIRAEVTL